MSLARSLAASIRISLTSLTTEASWACLASSLSSVSSLRAVRRPRARCIICATVSPPTPKCCLMRRAISRGLAQHRLNFKPVKVCNSSRAYTSIRVASRDDQRAVLARHRHQVLAMHEFAWHYRDRFGR